MSIPTHIGLAVVLALVTAAPAVASHGGPHPTLRTERNYFTCVGNSKVQNVSMLQGVYPGWRTASPTQSFQEGAGCGTVDTNVNSTSTRNPYDGVWEGTFRGNLDRMTVDVHALDAGLSRVNLTYPVMVDLIIDGTTRANDVRVEPPVIRSATGGTVRLLFSVTGIGLKPEDGDGTRQRTVTIALSNYADYQGAWVWDATEVPAGVTFNPTALAATRIQL